MITDRIGLLSVLLPLLIVYFMRGSRKLQVNSSTHFNSLAIRVLLISDSICQAEVFTSRYFLLRILTVVRSLRI